MAISVPWKSLDQWRSVAEEVMAGTETRWLQAITLMSVWKSRGGLCAEAAMTCGFMEAMLKDRAFRSGDSGIAEEELQNLFAILITRFIAYYADPLRSMWKNAATRCAVIGIPSELVDLRNQIAHREMPPLESMRHAAFLSLNYIIATYWQEREVAIQKRFACQFEKIEKGFAACVAAACDVESPARGNWISREVSALMSYAPSEAFLLSRILEVIHDHDPVDSSALTILVGLICAESSAGLTARLCLQLSRRCLFDGSVDQTRPVEVAEHALLWMRNLLFLTDESLQGRSTIVGQRAYNHLTSKSFALGIRKFLEQRCERKVWDQLNLTAQRMVGTMYTMTRAVAIAAFNRGNDISQLISHASFQSLTGNVAFHDLVRPAKMKSHLLKVIKLFRLITSDADTLKAVDDFVAKCGVFAPKDNDVMETDKVSAEAKLRDATSQNVFDIASLYSDCSNSPAVAKSAIIQISSCHSIPWTNPGDIWMDTML